MKKAIAMVLTASMAVASLAGCGSSSSKTSTTSSVVTETGSGAAAATSGTAAASGNSDMKVAMITDYGDITDQSFNQTTYEACKAFCKDNSLEFTYYKPDGNNDSDREAMVDKAVSDGYNVIVMPGYAFAQCLVDESPMYPDVKFIALDVSQDDIDGAENADSYTGDNVYCAIYQEQIPGYMAGYAAVKMGYKKLGFLGGMARQTSKSSMSTATHSREMHPSRRQWIPGIRQAHRSSSHAAVASGHQRLRQLRSTAARSSVSMSIRRELSTASTATA